MPTLPVVGFLYTSLPFAVHCAEADCEIKSTAVAVRNRNTPYLSIARSIVISFSFCGLGSKSTHRAMRSSRRLHRLSGRSSDKESGIAYAKKLNQRVNRLKYGRARFIGNALLLEVFEYRLRGQFGKPKPPLRSGYCPVDLAELTSCGGTPRKRSTPIYEQLVGGWPRYIAPSDGQRKIFHKS